MEGADLSGLDLRWINISGSHITNSNFHKADLSWANLSGANLAKSNFAEANLVAIDLSYADLEDADLSHTNVARANFYAVDLRGALLTELKNWDQIQSIQSANIHGIRNAPEDFVTWATSHGAVELESDEDW